MMPIRSQIVTCETPAALVIHLREVGYGEVNYSGRDAYALTLCLAPVGRDTKHEVSDANCSACLAVGKNGRGVG